MPDAAGRGPGKFDSRFNGFGPGIGKEYLVEMRHECQQALGQNTGKCRHAHLHKVGQLAVKHGIEGFANRRVITPNAEHAPAAQQIEILLAVLVVQILPDTTLIPLVEADSLEHMHHLFVEMARMQLIALDLPLGDELLDVKAHSPPPKRDADRRPTKNEFLRS